MLQVRVRVDVRLCGQPGLCRGSVAVEQSIIGGIRLHLHEVYTLVTFLFVVTEYLTEAT